MKENTERVHAFAPSVISRSEMPAFSGENGNPFVALRHFPY